MTGRAGLEAKILQLENELAVIRHAQSTSAKAEEREVHNADALIQQLNEAERVIGEMRDALEDGKNQLIALSSCDDIPDSIYDSLSAADAYFAKKMKE